MANYIVIVPFIREREGGLSRNPNDAARDNACPYPFNGTHYHTSAGITWLVWKSIYGDSPASAQAWFRMDKDQWGYIFETLYWNKNLLDKVNSQRIANVIGDWDWCSGSFYPDKHVQHVLNRVLPTQIAEDGIFGVQTLSEINSAPEEEFYNYLIEDHKSYLAEIASSMDKKEPGTGSNNLTGWINRVNLLVEFNSKLQ